MRQMMALILMATTAALVFTGAAFWCLDEDLSDPDSVLHAARDAFDEHRYADAIRLSNQILQSDSSSISAIIIGGASAAAEKQFDQAWDFYSKIREINSVQTANAGCVAAHLLAFERHQLSAALMLNRKVLEYDPRHVGANSGYANLLGLTGQRWEAVSPTIELIRQGQFSTNQLILIGSESGVHDDDPFLNACIKTTPDDPLAALGMAWSSYRAGRMEESRKWAESAVQLDPNLLSAQALLGSLLVASKSGGDEFSSWHQGLPKSANNHPEIWLARGQRAQAEGDSEAAIRCYWESSRRNPNYRIALYQLSQLLIQRQDAERAQPFLRRAEQLQRLKEAEAALFEGVQDSLKPIQRVAEQMEALGRYWETWGWCQFALRLDAQASWPATLASRAQNHLNGQAPLTDESVNPAFLVDLSSFPLPVWKDKRSVQPLDKSSNHDVTSMISFDDEAAAAGVQFTYFNSADARVAGQQMYEFTGGGVGSLDYDLDGWPDLYLTQGCRWPTNPSNEEHLDRFCRNLGTGRFLDVTTSCGIHEPSFTQGLAVGDYDNDGFPDLFVGNIGANRLFHNQGDGTFRETTNQLPSIEGRWTTSCAMADLNGDTWPDLYAINYVEGDDVFARMCHHKDGVPRMCAPFDFPGAKAQFLISQGDGSFRDASAESGLDAPNGKGLGLLIADFDHSGKLAVFVANDLVPNFLYVNRAISRGGPALFDEVGLARGVALNADGQAQGCMGIAADDFNGDGRLDLFVTNFYMEPNTLYLQIENDVFVDATQAAGLVQPSLPMLGFGVQSIDADLDGIRDFVVTNGHVDDHRAYGQPYAMRPQVFRGNTNCVFRELSPETTGPFFQQERLGRGMCRLDWNRDGREDIAISHLESPAALLTNKTVGAGHSLVLHLRGVESDRDAIGAIVTVRTGRSEQTRQLTAGDGYQGCNQRSLIFGLDQDLSAVEVVVVWPSGGKQSFLNVQADREWLCLEDRIDLVSVSPETPRNP